jgi:hypothetical protein
MESLNLGPLDLVFGDERQRTEVYRCGSPEMDDPPWQLPLLEEKLERLNTVALEGTCHRCDKHFRPQFHHTYRTRLFHCFIQCHNYPDSSDHNRRPIDNHILIYDTTKLSLAELTEIRCPSDNTSATQKPTLNPRLYSFDALITIIRLHEKFYKIFDDRPWSLETAQARRALEYMPPPWIHGRPSRAANGLLHEYIQQWVGSSVLAPKEKIGYTSDMVDAVWLEDKAKPEFIEALAAHGFKLLESSQWSLRYDRVTEGLKVDITLKPESSNV